MNKYLAAGLGSLAGATLSYTLTMVSETTHNDCYMAIIPSQSAYTPAKGSRATQACYGQHPVLSWFTGYRGVGVYTHLGILTVLGGVAAYSLAKRRG